MYKAIDTPAQNSASICGTLLNVTVREGTTRPEKGSKAFRSMTPTIRVKQSYGETQAEISEIPVSIFAMAKKKDGDDNKIYLSMGNVGNEFHWANRDGDGNADEVSISGYRGNGSLRENMFASRNSDVVISSLQVDARFLSQARESNTAMGQYATFDVEIFILNIERELDKEGEETGRLKLRGGVVQYGPAIDCFDFFVEDKGAVDFIERNYNVNDTAHFCGRIRYTSEVITQTSENSWGEVMPRSTTRKRHELIITGPGAGGETGPYLDEEKCYDPQEIRVLINDRNTRKEQVKFAAANSSKQTPITKQVAKMGMSWDDDD